MVLVLHLFELNGHLGLLLMPSLKYFWIIFLAIRIEETCTGAWKLKSGKVILASSLWTELWEKIITYRLNEAKSVCLQGCSTSVV